ncbi:chemotaxis protein CheA [Desulfovibrio cuneatus]|uniref:chemotaxis protein CheA n=1 Tax=Desulfovibrio cuneatus TaxID=159728 RepID=UPI000419750E|nr:chemotaxis protein CheA [Desulfovibrio cuneatus]
MSQDFIDAELFADFIIEAKEHLETIEPNLLELEKAPDNLSLLNEIFRPMHSLKGASGFLGLNRINGLAHKAENILDELRKGTIAVNSEIMDVILASTDALRQIIDNLEKSNTEGDVDTAPLIVTLDSLLEAQLAHGGAPKAAPAPAPQAAAPAPIAPAPQATTQEAPEQLQGEDAAIPQEIEEKSSGDVPSWLARLPRKEGYQLTAFGESHLKDFMEEAKENTSCLTTGLLELEKNPDEQHDELVNDLFRFFHNLKGNSGIIGFAEVNSLTHEAETLLNSVRKNEYPVSSALVDLLLLVVDTLDALVTNIDISTSRVSPLDPEDLLIKLRQAVAGGAVELPESLRNQDVQPSAPSEQAPPAISVQNTQAASQELEKISAFKSTIAQQKVLLDEALQGFRTDGTNQIYADAMFRALSTVQSSCSFMGLDEIKSYTERTANIVKQGRETDLDFSMMADLLEQECAIIIDMVGNAIPGLEAALPAEPPAVQPATETPLQQTAQALEAIPPSAEKVEAPAASAPPAPKPAPTQGNSGGNKAPAKQEESTAKTSSTIRVDHEKLDHLMNLIGELIINRNRYTMISRQLEASDKHDIGLIAQNLSETTYAMARISDDLQDTIMKVRMVPVASVFSRFPRLVRDLSRKSGKDVDLVVEGEETELDKSVVEVIGDPLVHLIRNSMDHGIEPDEIRRTTNKPPKGTVWLRAFYRGNSVAIEIEDDGKGIDPEVMRQVAVRKGVITAEEAKLLDDREAIELIFAPGFSSAEVITDISGRGVGMDVVRTNIKNLKGSIGIQSEVGKGTKFTLLLPLTLAIIDALMVNVAQEMYAIPLDAVSETTKIEAHRLTDVKGRKAVTLRGEVLGIVSLAELLGLPCNMAQQEMLSVVVIQDNERRLGLVVDRLLERQEIVIKPLSSYLGDLKGISGATIMGDGSVILILEPHEIYTLAIAK